MTMLLSVLAVALTGSTSVAGLANKVTEPQKVTKSAIVTNNLPATKEEIEIISFSKELSVAIDNLKDELGLTEELVKTMIEESIAYSENGEINFSLTKLSSIKGTNFYQLVSSNERLANLTLAKLIDEGLLYKAENESFSFKENQTLSPYNSHIWAVHQWSWFVYWELHFDSDITQTIAFLTAIGASIIEDLGPIDGFWGVGIEAIGKACQALSDEFSDKDNGNGVCLRWDAIVPRDLVSR